MQTESLNSASLFSLLSLSLSEKSLLWVGPVTEVARQPRPFTTVGENAAFVSNVGLPGGEPVGEWCWA